MEIGVRDPGQKNQPQRKTIPCHDKSSLQQGQYTSYQCKKSDVCLHISLHLKDYQTIFTWDNSEHDILFYLITGTSFSCLDKTDYTTDISAMQ
jgi:hypothetical protein